MRVSLTTKGDLVICVVIVLAGIIVWLIKAGGESE